MLAETAPVPPAQRPPAPLPQAKSNSIGIQGQFTYPAELELADK